MAIVGNQTLHGIQLENSYVHITRVNCIKQYSQVGNDWIKLYTIDYDFGVFPSKTQYELEPNNPLKMYFRARFQEQIVEDSISDIWELSYNNLKNQLSFKDFEND